MLYRFPLAICLLSISLASQPSTRFELVSIRVVPPNAPPLIRDIGFTSVRPGGQYIDPRTPVTWLIQFAYHIPADFQLTGVPDWAKNQTFSISAKPAADF